MTKRFIKPGDDVDGPLYSIQTDGEMVCASHTKSDYINHWIRTQGEKVNCTYCNKLRNCIELSDLLDLIVVGIDCLFEDPANSRYLNKDSEYGFDGNVFDFYELWHEDRLGLEINNDKLFEDAFKYFNCDQLFVDKDEFGSELEYFEDVWAHFTSIVKYKARYVFHREEEFQNHQFTDPVTILFSIEKSIKNFNLFKTIPANSILYRCRQHEKNAVKNGADMASPPSDCQKVNGRMSPAGISMFYCSQKKALTIQEVVRKSRKDKPYYSTAIFRNNKSLNLVDLSIIPEIPSIYDSDKNHTIAKLLFLKGFSNDISKSINDSDEIIEYIPTQIVTEYIKYNKELKADGIIYNSSKNDKMKNIVLFFDHEQSTENLTFSERSLRTNKWK